MNTRGTQTRLVAIAGTALLLAVGSSAAYAHPIKCYQLAEKPGSLNIDVTISDQFHSGPENAPTGLVGPEEKVKIVNPHFLCTPVEKKCIVNPDDPNAPPSCELFIPNELPHFLCWKISPSGPPVNLDVNALDSEFAFAFEDGKVPVKVQTAQLLCEPVVKEVVEETIKQLRSRK
jgi:hypothetical protein